MLKMKSKVKRKYKKSKILIKIKINLILWLLTLHVVFTLDLILTIENFIPIAIFDLQLKMKANTTVYCAKIKLIQININR